MATQKEKLSKVESLVRERRFVLLSELADNLDLSYYYVRALVKTAIQVNPQLALVDGLLAQRSARGS